MYLDSCVIVKLVSHEIDSAAYHAIVAGHPIVTSELAVAEVRSALLTKERAGRISRSARLAGWRLFQEKVHGHEFVLLPLDRRANSGQSLVRCPRRTAKLCQGKIADPGNIALDHVAFHVIPTF